MLKRTHLAGIIPVTGFTGDHGTCFNSVLLPIEQHFTMLQKSVYECAIAGCKTIWIVANDDMTPIIRRHIGEWTYDPVYYNRGRTIIGTKNARLEIPIYYVPILPKDRDRRDSFGWSVLFGMHSAWWISFRISKWAIPDKYFVSFPHSVHNIHQLRKDRRLISHNHNNYFLSYKEKTIKDGLPISFSMRGKDFIACRQHVNQLTTKTYAPLEKGGTYEDLQKLPLQERWSARRFTLDTVFEKIKEQDAHYNELDWYYDLSDWAGYRAYLGSKNVLPHPGSHLTGAHKHAKLCVDEE